MWFDTRSSHISGNAFGENVEVISKSDPAFYSNSTRHVCRYTCPTLHKDRLDSFGAEINVKTCSTKHCDTAYKMQHCFSLNIRSAHVNAFIDSDLLCAKRNSEAILCRLNSSTTIALASDVLKCNLFICLYLGGSCSF